MLYFSYRNRLRLRSLLGKLLIAAVILLAAAIGIFIYLQRYITYTPDGVKLDFSMDRTNSTPANPNFTVEQPIPGAELVPDESGDEEPVVFTQLSGYYITGAMLAKPEEILSALPEAGEAVAVLMDVRSIFGNYYYPAGEAGAETSSLVDPQAVQTLIETLAHRRGVYLIARLPAFRDSAFALSDLSCGLSLSSGALWMDDDSCYWLDPAEERVLSRLEATVLELSGLGFDEVVLSDFRFPDSANISYDGDGPGAILAAAAQLSKDLPSVTLSLEASDPALAPYAARLYAQEEDGSRVGAVAAGLEGAYDQLPEHLVFLTASRDTRFAEYGLLKPLLSEE